MQNGILMIDTENGIVEVATSQETKIRLPQKDDAGLNDLVEGDRVAISQSERDGQLVADKIAVIPGKTLYRHVVGVVFALSESQITIAPPSHEDDPVTFDRMTGTKVRFHRNASKLKEGVFVVIVAVRDPASGELLPGAIEVIVLPGRPGGQAGVDPEEVEKLLSLNRAQIKGVLEQVDSEGNWTVGGTKVAVRAVTRLEKGLAIGQFVEVEAALTPEGVLVALHIEARQVDRAVATRTLIVGSFEGAEGQGVWSISGIPVLVGPDSDTDGLPD